MATYIGVNAVRKKGVKIERSFDPHPQAVSEGKRLVGILGNGAWEIASDLTNPSDYLELRESYEEGFFSDCEFYELEEEELPNCPNEGRNLLQ